MGAGGDIKFGMTTRQISLGLKISDPNSHVKFTFYYNKFMFQI